MKTTVELPDRLLRAAKTTAAGRGLSLKSFLTEALTEKLAGLRRRRTGWPVLPPKLAPGEMRRIQAAVDVEFSQVKSEDWK